MRLLEIRGWLGAVCLLAGLGLAGGASAASITTVLGEFTGDDATVRVTFDDMAAGPGEIQITVEVVEDPNIGDLRGLFLNITDDSLLAGLDVTGADVTDFDTGNVRRVGGGNNVNGGGSPCPCDIGIEFGSPGMGRDDIRMTVLVLSHDTVPLDISLLADQEIGVRLTSVGLEGSDREGSSKLATVVPEPSTALLLGLGLAAFGGIRRGRHGTRLP